MVRYYLLAWKKTVKSGDHILLDFAESAFSFSLERKRQASILPCWRRNNQFTVNQDMVPKPSEFTLSLSFQRWQRIFSTKKVLSKLAVVCERQVVKQAWSRLCFIPPIPPPHTEPTDGNAIISQRRTVAEFAKSVVSQWFRAFGGHVHAQICP